VKQTNKGSMLRSAMVEASDDSDSDVIVRRDVECGEGLKSKVQFGLAGKFGNLLERECHLANKAHGARAHEASQVTNCSGKGSRLRLCSRTLNRSSSSLATEKVDSDAVMTVVAPHVKDTCVHGQMLRLPPNMQLNSSNSAGNRMSELCNDTVPSSPCTSAEKVTPLKLKRTYSTRRDRLDHMDSSVSCSSPEIICCSATPEPVTPQLPRRFIKSARDNPKSEIKSKTEGKTFSTPTPNRVSKFIQREREGYHKQSTALPSQTALFCDLCHARPRHNNFGLQCDERQPRLCFVCSQRSTENNGPQRNSGSQRSSGPQKSSGPQRSSGPQGSNGLWRNNSPRRSGGPCGSSSLRISTSPGMSSCP